MKLNRKQTIVIGIVFAIILITTFLNLDLRERKHIRDGIWVNGYGIGRVDLDVLAKNGVKNIFLHESAVKRFGVSTVEKWISDAESKNISVHLWVQCFYNGTWINPIDTSKKDFNYLYFNKKINEIENYTSINGVKGIMLDYVRYPGDAYKYDYSWWGTGVNGHNAITKFVAMVDDKLRYTNKTLSITVMPERGDGTKFYGQDVGALSHHVDVIVPMAYTGNYKKDSIWIKEIAKYYSEKSKPANVCIGIQDYVSDANEQPLNITELRVNCQSALDGGSDGIALFNWELMKNWFDLRTLNGTSEEILI
ncbi:MAG: putative glycoside hydrolase [Methanobrevibacter sp.]|jgi:hypothetical protein|nr:putative glycoside hydrolase [Candidatus Methanovirga basalitermitum]